MTKLTPRKTADMTQEERADANASKAPTNQSTRDICPAKVRHGDRAGEQCSRTAGLGTSHPGFGYCSKHGGNTPAGKKGAARAMGRQLIIDQKERFGGDRQNEYIMNITAETALLEEVRRSVAMVRWLEEKIGAWQIDGPDSEGGDLDGRALGLPALVEETSKGAPGMTDVQAWLLLYREERKHAAQVAKMCIDANISKRMVDLATTQGTVLTVVIREVLKALNLNDFQASLVPSIVPNVIQQATIAMDRKSVSKDAFEEVVVYGVTDKL